jgi:hypothetical protein
MHYRDGVLPAWGLKVPDKLAEKAEGKLHRVSGHVLVLPVGLIAEGYPS